MLLSVKNRFRIVTGRIKHTRETIRIQLLNRQDRHDITRKTEYKTIQIKN